MQPSFQGRDGRTELGVASLARHLLALALPVAVLALGDGLTASGPPGGGSALPLAVAAISLGLGAALDAARGVIAGAGDSAAPGRLARIDLLFLPLYLVLLAMIGGWLALPVALLLGLFGAGAVALRVRWIEPARAARTAALAGRDRVVRAALADPLGLEAQGLGPVLARTLRVFSRAATEALARFGAGLVWREAAAAALGGAALLALLALAAPRLGDGRLDPAAFAASLLLAAQAIRLTTAALAALPLPARPDPTLSEEERDAADSTDLAFSLPPLLAALGWGGDARALAEALPPDSRRLDLTAWREALARLGFTSHGQHWRDRSLDQLEPGLPPCLVVAAGRAPLVLLPAAAPGQPVRAVGPDGAALADPGRARLSGTAWRISPVAAEAAASGWVARLRPLWLPALALSLLLAALDLAPALAVAAVAEGWAVAGPGAAPLLALGGLALAWSAAIAARAARAGLLLRLGTRLDSLTAEAAAAPPRPWRTLDGALRSAAAAMVWRHDLDHLGEGIVGPLGGAAGALPGIILPLGALGLLAGAAAVLPVLAGLGLLLLLALVLLPLARPRRDGRSRLGALAALPAPLATLIAASAVLTLVADQIAAGGVTAGGGLGRGLAAAMLAWSALEPVRALLADLPRLARGRAALRHLGALPRPHPPVLHPWRPVEPAEVVLSGVTARAVPWAPPVFRDFSLTLPAGEVLAVAGPPRAGSSTLLRLIAGVQLAEQGLVRVDGLDLAQLTAEERRRRFLLVPAGGFPRFGSVRAALRDADPEAGEPAWRAACERVGLWGAIVALPGQLDTRLESATLPPGFGFRLALARADLAQPPALLIDLGAERLDPAGEQALAATIARFRGRSTLVLVSTRPSHWQLANRVLLLERGTIRYLGPPGAIESVLAEKVP